MLVLKRRKNERIVVNGPCVIKIADVCGGSVKVGIEADPEVLIVREELLTAKQKKEIADAS